MTQRISFLLALAAWTLVPFVQAQDQKTDPPKTSAAAQKPISSEDSAARDGNDPPSTYFSGLTVDTVLGEAAHWPAKGMVISARSKEGQVTQCLTSASDGAPKILVRVSENKDSWGHWSTPGGDLTVHTKPVLKNSWKDNGGDGGVRIVKQGETVFFQGDISDGSIAPGTELFALPEGYRPFNQRVTVVCAGGADRDEFVVLMITADGVVTVQKPPKNPRIYLDSVSFVTKDAFR